MADEKSTGGFHIRTISSVSTYDFTWSVEKRFIKCPVGTKVTSPEFHPESGKTFYATLEIKKGSYNYCHMMFHLKSGSSIVVEHKVSIIGLPLDKMSKSHNYQTGYVSCGFEYYLYSIEQYITDVKDQDLIFKCTMEFDTFKSNLYNQPNHSLLLDDQSVLIDNVPEYNDTQNLSVLIDDLKTMYTTSLHADITLKVGNELVPVHKSLLCARSPVFSKMFEILMGENVIEINDFKLSVVKDLLEFLYTGLVSNKDFESVYALYYAADSYEVSSLREICVIILLSKLDIENVCSVLALADKHNDIDFKKSVIGFIQSHFEDILSTDTWDRFVEDKPKMASEVMKINSKKWGNERGRSAEEKSLRI